MELTTMSQLELNRLETIQRILDKRLSVVDAASHLSLSRSQVHRLIAQYRKDGASGLISKKRGKPSNRRYPDTVRNFAIHIVTEHYADFGPTFAAEKLRENHELSVSKETLRKWMMEADLWQHKTRRKDRIHQPRHRRDRFGELIQIDGSHHPWFEDRGPKCALLVYVDDATSKIVHLRFAESENAFDYFHATKAYLAKYGKPTAFYSDKHGVFRTTHASNKDATTGMTQFGRALHELNIDIICANSPQAKGRVERANKTLQDRLVKELRLREISTIDEANSYAPAFIADYNKRFGKTLLKPEDVHRQIAPHESLDGAMCHKVERTLSGSLTLRYDKVLFIIEPTALAKSLRRKRVIVCDYPDGRLEIQHHGKSLAYRTFDKLRSVSRANIVEHKRLGAVLEYVAEEQAKREISRSRKAPKRTGQKDHMFEVP